MKKQNKLILSTFIAFSSIIALKSTSLADNIDYKDQIFLVNEEYKESIAKDSLKEDKDTNYDLEANVENDESNELEYVDNLKDYENEIEEKELDKHSYYFEKKQLEDKNLKKDSNDLDRNKNILETKTHKGIKEVKDNTEDPNSEYIESKYFNNKIEGSISDKEETKDKNKHSNNIITFYSTNTRSRSLNYSDSSNSYVIEEDSVYKYDNYGNKTTISNSWVNIGKDKYFANSKGKVVKGIQKIGFDRFYFSNNGILKTNTKIITNLGAYSIGESGIMNPIKNRRIEVNANKYHTGSDGKLDKGFNIIENKLYSFDDKGKLERNKMFLYNNSVIAIDTNGIVDKKRNTKTVIDNYEYTSDKNGKVVSIKDLSKEAEVVTYYIQNSKAYKKYSNNKTTLAKNEWIKVSGKDYRTDSNGNLMFGVHKIGNHYYNLTENGLGRDYRVFIDNNLYDFDNFGKGKLLSSNYKPNKDLDVAIGWMFQAMNYNYEYNMDYPYRDMIGYADCSSAVYRAMKHGGFISSNTANGNTETLFDLGRRGQVLKQISENEIRYGDIFVAGVPGKSLGAGGHTGFILDKNTIIHCNWTDRGISITPRKGRMGDNKYPVSYYRLVGGKSNKYYI